jgi:hypothetical protein
VAARELERQASRQLFTGVSKSHAKTGRFDFDSPAIESAVSADFSLEASRSDAFRRTHATAKAAEHRRTPKHFVQNFGAIIF